MGELLPNRHFTDRCHARTTILSVTRVSLNEKIMDFKLASPNDIMEQPSAILVIGRLQFHDDLVSE